METRTGLLRFLSKYDEYTYWNSRADPNASRGWDEQRRAYDTAYIREQIGDSRQIVEFGPGVGRTFEAYSPASRITCYDITANYRDRLLAEATRLDLSVTHEVAFSADAPLPYADGSFDVAVASQVFQHQRPERIERTMRELIRVAKRVVAIASWGDRRRSGRRSHAFHHDYVALCGAIGCEMNGVRWRDGTIYFVYGRA